MEKKKEAYLKPCMPEAFAQEQVKVHNDQRMEQIILSNLILRINSSFSFI